jgi:hypothetical protein
MEISFETLVFTILGALLIYEVIKELICTIFKITMNFALSILFVSSLVYILSVVFSLGCFFGIIDRSSNPHLFLASSVYCILSSIIIGYIISSFTVPCMKKYNIYYRMIEVQEYLDSLDSEKEETEESQDKIGDNDNKINEDNNANETDCFILKSNDNITCES